VQPRCCSNRGLEDLHDQRLDPDERSEVSFMSTSGENLKKAEECYRMASAAKTDADRLACLELARTFLEAASSEGEMHKGEREKKPKAH
jgi:hypothetical protein